MLPICFIVINVIVLTYILISSLLAANQMSKYTPHQLRLLYTFLAVGAFYSLLQLHLTNFPALLSNLALAYLVHKFKVSKCEITGTNHKALNI